MQNKNSFTVLKIALIFVGYYQHVAESKTVRILIKLYCLVFEIWCFRLLYLAPNPVVLSTIIQNLFMFCVCIFSKEPFLFKYYNQAISFDYGIGVDKIIFSKYSKFVTALFIVICFCNIHNRYIYYAFILGFDKIMNLNYELLTSGFLCDVGHDFAQGMTIATIAILHCQVAILDSSLKRLGFVNSPKHNEMYDFINECFSSVQQPVKIQILTYVIFMALQLIIVASNSITGFLHLKEIYATESLAKVFVFAGLFMLPRIIFAIFPFIILELVANKYDEIKLYLHNQRIVSLNERRKEEITALLQFLNVQPLRFTAWRMFSLDMRLIFSLFFGLVSYLVTALQMSHLFDNNT